MHVGELWRFPVKSLRGERVTSVELTDDGVRGDRIAHVRRRQGLVTARTRPALLGLSATTGPDGEPLVDGHPVDDPLVTAALSEAVREPAWAVRYTGRERFDVLPLLVATDGAIAEFGHDGRRLRPNIVVAGVSELDERHWPSHGLRIGSALIGVYSLRERCVMTTVDPDTGERDPDVLRRIHLEFDGRMALNCWVIEGGEIRVGDPVELVAMALDLPRSGGWVTGAPYRVG